MTYLELLAVLDEMIENEEINQFDEVDKALIENLLNRKDKQK